MYGVFSFFSRLYIRDSILNLKNIRKLLKIRSIFKKKLRTGEFKVHVSAAAQVQLLYLYRSKKIETFDVDVTPPSI